MPAYTQTNTAYDFVITVSTPQVAGQPGLDNGGHHIRIVLPSDYYSNPTKRYPVLYLFNGSTPGADPANYWWFPSINSNAGMIFVMPDGGARGWYSNWLTRTAPPARDVIWNNIDPGAHVSALAGMGVSVYVA
ncbi:hypothetical protein ABH926_007698 [Catenulispora sp. GP43]|uniref:alpha/beta hydrolase-fold protein n=1 Tax=Catenulispora sp. GP43 TaxID=3156263 RepID=UPI0035159FB6